MKIIKIYEAICDLYDVESPLNVEHYLMLCPDFPGAVRFGNRMPNREALFICDNGGDVELGLFINPEIIMKVERGDELRCVDELGCVVEGLSHFVYVADRVSKNKKFSRLELELQAEVDKFIIINLIASMREGCAPPEFFEKQFETFEYADGMAAEDVERYSAANHFAAKFCNSLRRRYFNPLNLSGLVGDARAFFSGDLSGKLQRLIP